jgi:hypothetical protein
MSEVKEIEEESWGGVPKWEERWGEITRTLQKPPRDGTASPICRSFKGRPPPTDISVNERFLFLLSERGSTIFPFGLTRKPRTSRLIDNAFSQGHLCLRCWQSPSGVMGSTARPQRRQKRRCSAVVQCIARGMVIAAWIAAKPCQPCALLLYGLRLCVVYPSVPWDSQCRQWASLTA